MAHKFLGAISLPERVQFSRRNSLHSVPLSRLEVETDEKLVQEKMEKGLEIQFFENLNKTSRLLRYLDHVEISSDENKDSLTAEICKLYCTYCFNWSRFLMNIKLDNMSVIHNSDLRTIFDDGCSWQYLGQSYTHYWEQKKQRAARHMINFKGQFVHYSKHRCFCRLIAFVHWIKSILMVYVPATYPRCE